jgi:hypothetical protein
LHADVKVVIELEQVESRHRTGGNVDLELLRLEPAATFAAPDRRHEILDDVFGLADHLEVGLLIDMRARRDVRPADGHRLAVRLDQIDQLERVELLHQHAAGHDDIGPCDIGIGQRLGVAIDQPQVPVGGKQRSQRDQPEGRCGIARAGGFTGRLVIPERLVEEAWINEEDVQRGRVSILHSSYPPRIEQGNASNGKPRKQQQTTTSGADDHKIGSCGGASPRNIVRPLLTLVAVGNTNSP